MSKRQKRLLAIVMVLLLILLALGAYFLFYQRTKKLSFDLGASMSEVVIPPEFMFSFSGAGADRIQRPIGVLVDANRVFVTDAVRSRILVFDLSGNLRSTFGASDTITPLYLAKNPVNGSFYVTDRGRHQVLIFSPQLKFTGVFEPNLPKGLAAKPNPAKAKWTPLAIAFAPDGTLYVTETLYGHRLLIFGPDGKIKKAVGNAGIAADPSKDKDAFLFPNGMFVSGRELYIADSNNQRIKVYTLGGKFKRLIATSGLPRGIAMLDPLPGDSRKSPRRFVEIDTLAHDATMWTASGEKILTFGEQGVLDAQFNFPNSVAKGPRNRLYIADTANGRVQVWGWPTQEAGLPPITRKTVPWCLLPLLLLPFLLLLRKREYFATADFVEEIIEADQADLMPGKRVKWITTQSEYALIETMSTENVDMSKLFVAVEYSESDVKALEDRYELDHETAVLVAVAQRARLTCTENDDLRRMAKFLEIDVVNAQEFVEKRSERSDD